MMTLGVLAAVGIAIMLFSAGYTVAHVDGMEQIHELLDRFAILRGEDVAKLSHLRTWLETEAGGVSAEQAFLLIDVCTQLGFSEQETQTVVGPAYLLLLDEPIGAFAGQA